MLYLLLKWIHVLSAIVAVGANLTYGVWIARASRQPEALPFTLRGIKLIDDRLANPAYGLLLLTGLLMVLTFGWPWTTPWLLSGMFLFALVIMLGLLGFTPVLRHQIEALESEGSQSASYLALARRSTILGIVLAVLALTIVFLMVVKPAMW